MSHRPGYNPKQPSTWDESDFEAACPPERIAAECAVIRAGWSEKVLRERGGVSEAVWTVPECNSAPLTREVRVQKER